MIDPARAAQLLPLSRQNLAALRERRAAATNARTRAALDKQIENVEAAIRHMEKIVRRARNLKS